MKYYLHDSNSFNDEKITLLYINFGYEALGLFYTIIEKLAAQEKPILETVLLSQLKIGKKLKKQLKFMYEIDILSVNNGEVFSKTLLNFSEKYQIKKEKNRKRVSEWRNNQDVKKNVTHYETVSNTPKVNKSKVNKSKVIIYPFDSEKFINFWDLWKEYKKTEFKFNYKSEISEQAALKKLSGFAKGDENTAIKILEDAISNGYKGFFEIKDNGRNNQTRKKPTFSEAASEFINR